MGHKTYVKPMNKPMKWSIAIFQMSIKYKIFESTGGRKNPTKKIKKNKKKSGIAMPTVAEVRRQFHWSSDRITTEGVEDLRLAIFTSNIDHLVND